MELQLTELYYAFALAYTSSRILVLPKMTCMCIQNWCGIVFALRELPAVEGWS